MTMGLIWRRIPWLLAVPAGGSAVYVLLQSGSRGPLFSAIVAIGVGALLARVRATVTRSVVIVALIGTGVLVSFAAAPFYAQQRIEALLQGGASGSVGTRVGLYDVAERSITADPLGIGWGNYQHIVFSGYTYPHNLFLEVLVEAGVLLGGLFLLWIVLTFWQAQRATTDFAGGASFAVLTFMLGTATVSGDLNDNRTFFLALGIAIAAGAIAQRAARAATPAGADGTPVAVPG